MTDMSSKNPTGVIQRGMAGLSTQLGESLMRYSSGIRWLVCSKDKSGGWGEILQSSKKL